MMKIWDTSVLNISAHVDDFRPLLASSNLSWQQMKGQMSLYKSGTWHFFHKTHTVQNQFWKFIHARCFWNNFPVVEQRTVSKKKTKEKFVINYKKNSILMTIIKRIIYSKNGNLSGRIIFPFSKSRSIDHRQMRDREREREGSPT